MSWTVTKTLVQQMWEKLDVEYESLVMSGDESWKHKARSTAECIAIFMPPHFRTADEVVKEAVKRFKAKEAGEDYETPGLGTRRYETPEEWHATRGGFTTNSDIAKANPPSASKRPSTRVKPVATSENVPDDTKRAIKMGLESGMFSEADLARAYGLSIEVVHSIRRSVDN